MQRADAKSIGIKALSRKDITHYLSDELGVAAFRATQLIEWLYGKGATSYDEMTNLPVTLRSQLAHNLPLLSADIVRRQISRDGTRKYLVRLADDICVESVGIPSGNRLSVCVSTQAGCPMRCAFCATGQNGYVRSLGPGEIVDEVRLVQRDFGLAVSNVVLMGQGEPFLNYDASLEAMRIINDRHAFHIGSRHITVSTCGLIPQIRRFAAEPEQFTLAISLHSARQETRNILMPGVRSYSLERLHECLASYTDKTHRRPTYEYTLIDGINDSDEELRALVKFCRGSLCHVNLIPLNTHESTSYRAASQERMRLFEQTLTSSGIETSIRVSRGSDIDAACGQLKQ